MRFRLITLFVTIMSLCIVDANPIASTVGAKHSAFVNVGEEPTVPYVQDGLVFISEGFETPDTNWELNIGTEVPAIDWTLEWCGVHVGTKRSNCFMAWAKGPSSTHGFSFNFSIGWWANSNGANINMRCYTSEQMSNQLVGDVVCLAYTVKDGTALLMYADGELFGNRSGSVVQNAISMYGDSVGYIGGGAGDKLTVYSVRIYNRALTAEEIAYNAQIDRERFGE